MKSSSHILSSFLYLAYFMIGLAMCTLCVNHSLWPAKQGIMQIGNMVDNHFIAQIITRDDDVVVTHFLQ